MSHLIDDVSGGGSGDDPVRRQQRRRDVGPAVGWVLLVGAVVGAVSIGMLPSPYVIERPGPVYDTLGSVEIDGDDVPLIDIPDATTYPTEGELDMLTVYVDGSRENPRTWVQVALAWFDPTRGVLPVDAVYPEGQTEEQSDEESSIDMQNSQSSAVAAALTELDIPFETTVIAAGVQAGAPADGVLEAGDEIVAVDGVPIGDPDELRAAIAANGTDAALSIDIRRDGRDLTVTLTPAPSEDDPAVPVIGILTGATYDFPVDVGVTLDNVGGPSAGMMFALAIYDKLTPGALVDGEHVAGTGTIAPDGTVGPIGGIRQKLYGARDAGADWFLAPADNCDEVVGHVPSGITVFATASLDDSIEIVERIASGGDTGDLPTCE